MGIFDNLNWFNPQPAEPSPPSPTGDLWNLGAWREQGDPRFNPAASSANFPGYKSPVPGGASSPSSAGTWEEAGYLWYFDNKGEPVPFAKAPSATGMTATEQAAFDFKRWQSGWTGPGYETPYQEQITPYQQQQLEYQRQQAAQDAAYRQQQLEQEQKNYLAQLAAQPKSWLEYAATANTPPVIQPWMLPLMPQEYAGLPQAGEVIPGWTAQNMTGMPDLIPPSGQYMARMGPTAQQQYYGYMQADKAMTPEESRWRLWSMAPPSGRRGLTQVR